MRCFFIIEEQSEHLVCAPTCRSSRPLPALFSSTCVSHRQLSSPSSPGSTPSVAPAGNCVGPNQEIGESGRGWGVVVGLGCNLLLGTLLAPLSEVGGNPGAS